MTEETFTEKPHTIWRIISELLPYRRRIMLLISLAIVMAGADIIVPFITKQLIDRLVNALGQGQTLPLSVLGLAAAGILMATLVAQMTRSFYNYKLFVTVTSLEDKLRFRAYENYLRLHALFHHNVSSGQIIGRIDRGATGIYAVLNDVIGHYVLPPLVISLAVISVLLYKNPLVALVVFLPLPIYIFLTQKISNRIYEIEAKVNEQFETAIKEEYDVAGNILTVKRFSREQAEVTHQQTLRNTARQTQYASERTWAMAENIQTAIATIGRVSVIILAGYLVITGRSTIGEFVLFVTLQGMAYQPLAQLSVAFPRARRNASRAERLFQIMDEAPLIIDQPEAQRLPPHQKELVFSHVSFRYAEHLPWILKDINVHIPAKNIVAIVGRSGSGKTTFVNLLLRSYDPQEGQILIDGQDIRTVTQESLRSQIAIVPQEVDLFSRTISQNIAYGRPEASNQEIQAAAESALAHEFITRTENGYNTLVGERGLKLSGGERQRIGIARAILKTPHILILDEATSHLDTESERLVQKATELLMRNTTSIIIAHRLSTVLKADKILVFDQGEIVDEGPHRELLATNSIYQRLYAMQFQDE